MRTSLTFIIAFICFFWVGAQNVNPFDLHQGLQDSTKTTIEGSNVIVEVEPVPVISQTIPPEPEPQVEETALTPSTSSLDTVESQKSVPETVPESVNPFELRKGSESQVEGSETTVPQGEVQINTDEPEELIAEEAVILDDVIESSTQSIDTQVTSLSINPFDVVQGNNDSLTNLTVENATTVVAADEEITEETREKPVYVNTLPEKKNTFVFWLSLFSGLLLSFLLTANRKVINEILKSLGNVNYMKLFQKEERNGGSISFIILYIIYVLNASIFIRFAAIQYKLPLFGYNFILILLAVLTIVLLRHFSLNVVSYLRKRLPDAINYSFIIAMVNAIVGLILIPINLLIAFGPESMARNIVFLGIGILVAAFILKWLRGFVNSARIILGDSFHFLLYLCTCEIVPICICVGFLRNLIN